MIKTILVPTDGSEHASKAIDLAADIASKYDAKIVLLHVLLHNTSVYDLKTLGERLRAPASVIDRLDDVAQAMVDASATGYGGPVFLPADPGTLKEIGTLILEAAKLRVQSRSVEKIDAQMAEDAPADAILRAAEKESADMIVMGSRGLGKLAGMLMGSVSHTVSHMSKCTCVTVK
ncbi:MAG: universal stress protein [Rhodospirillaceae bacterium]